jgi:hypothetical protein
MPRSPLRPIFAVVLGILLLAYAPSVQAYSVLTHEEIVDLAWLPQIVPLLRARYPGLTDEQIREAHAFAYGGSVIQDIGFYPFGSHYFSDLLHYVRTGDFVGALLRDASTPDEYAFALGALAHYCGDTVGHPTVNQVTADEYPALRKRFGKSVTYEQSPTAHLRTEFGFDVAEVADGFYSQENYRDFIGFQVARPLLERAFRETYGLEMAAVVKHEDLAVGSYRYAVSSVIPRVTKVALVTYRDRIEKAHPGFDRSKFLYRIRRTEFEREYGRQYRKPGFGTHLLGVVLRLVPRVGPFRALDLKMPDSSELTLYLKSVNDTVDLYKLDLGTIASSQSPSLADDDLDTGNPTAEGEYRLSDQTHARLLADLAKAPPATIAPDLRDSLLAFYAQAASSNDALKKKPRQWRKLQASLARFQSQAPIPGN